MMFRSNKLKEERESSQYIDEFVYVREELAKVGNKRCKRLVISLIRRTNVAADDAPATLVVVAAIALPENCAPR